MLSNARYPRQMPPQQTTARSRFGFIGRPCHGGCGKVFAKPDPLVVVEVQVSPFRGDDEVRAYCLDCARRNGIQEVFP